MFTTCIWHEAPIVSRCRLTKCDLYAPGHALSCGLLAYQQVVPDLRTNEEIDWDKLAEWLGSEAEAVAQQAQQAYDQLRQERAAEPRPRALERVPNSRRCVVCNRKALLFEEQWGWCSKQCKDWLPKEAVEAEYRWGQRWRDLLHEWCSRRIQTICQLTGLPLETVRWLRWQHTGQSEIERPTRWLKCNEPLVPNPNLPTAKQLLLRLQRSKRWKE